MFSILVRNYIKSCLEQIGWNRKTKRFRHEFELGEYHIYIDGYCSFSVKSKMWNPSGIVKWKMDDIISHYSETLIKQDISWNGFVKTALDVIISCKESGDIKGLKIMHGFLESCILSSISPYGVHTYINKVEVRSLSYIRNEKLNKLLSDK